jgi:hypothetical protein
MPICPHAHMPTCPHAHMPTCPHAHMPTCPHAHMPTCPHAHMPTCQHAYMPTCSHVDLQRHTTCRGQCRPRGFHNSTATATPRPPYISRWQKQEGPPGMCFVPGWGLGGCCRALVPCTTATNTRPACRQAGFRAQLTATGTSQPCACTTHTAHTAHIPAHAGRISIIPTHTTALVLQVA